MQFPSRTGPTVNDAAPFSIEMALGHKPERPRLFTSRNSQGLSLSQTTHVAATFQPNMTQGWQPPTPVLVRGKIGWIHSEHTFEVVMAPDMFGGWHPDTNRVRLGPRIALPHNEAPTHDQTTFSEEMAEGWYPDTNRAFKPPKIGWSISQPTHTEASFSQDMVDGSLPDFPRRPFVAHVGWIDTQVTFLVQMTPEMFAGWHPDGNRQLLGIRIPLPIAQPTHTVAPITLDMLQGSRPDQPRLPFIAKVGWVDSQLTLLVAMTPEMFKGWMPERGRQVLGPKIPQPVSQPTHVAAPFGYEMVQGQQPVTRPRLPLGKQVVGWIVSIFDSITALFTISSASTKTTGAGVLRTSADGDLRATDDGALRSSELGTERSSASGVTRSTE
jgi:hypothetical protein